MKDPEPPWGKERGCAREEIYHSKGGRVCEALQIIRRIEGLSCYGY
jgi:hypothetical protein